MESDTLYALEWQKIQRGLCSGCGHPLVESLDEETDYVTHVVRCFACEVREARMDELSKEENANRHGLKVVPEKV